MAPKADLTFNSDGHPVNTAYSGALPMLCTPTICQVAVTKTLIDGGAGLSVLSVEAFSLLHVPPERLQPSSLTAPSVAVRRKTTPTAKLCRRLRQGRRHRPLCRRHYYADGLTGVR